MYELRCSMITYTYIYTPFTGVTSPFYFTPLGHHVLLPHLFTKLHEYHDMDYSFYCEILLMGS